MHHSDSEPRHCHFPWNEMIINQNGMVRFCCFQNYPIANLNKFNDIEEIWNSVRAQSVRYLLSLNKTPSL